MAREHFFLKVALSQKILEDFYLSKVNTVAAHLRAVIGLRAAFGKFLLHQNSSLCTVTFGEKVLTLHWVRAAALKCAVAAFQRLQTITKCRNSLRMSCNLDDVNFM